MFSTSGFLLCTFAPTAQMELNPDFLLQVARGSFPCSQLFSVPVPAPQPRPPPNLAREACGLLRVEILEAGPGVGPTGIFSSQVSPVRDPVSTD